ITAGSGLTDEEIQRMVREAEENRVSDKARREIVDTRNNLDALILACEKTLKDAGDKIAEQDKKDLQAAVDSAKTKLTSENLDELKGEIERLQNASHKIAEQLYSQAGAQPGADAGGANAGGNTDAGSSKKDDDDVVDADFKEV